jgi:hypothetical protein
MSRGIKVSNGAGRPHADASDTLSWSPATQIAGGTLLLARGRISFIAALASRRPQTGLSAASVRVPREMITSSGHGAFNWDDQESWGSHARWNGVRLCSRELGELQLLGCPL